MGDERKAKAEVYICPLCKNPFGFHLVLGKVCAKRGCKWRSCREDGITIDPVRIKVRATIKWMPVDPFTGRRIY